MMARKLSLIVIGILLTSVSFSQGPPAPPSGQGSTGNQNGGNAPVGSGIAILLGLGIAYGSKKVYDLKKEDLE